MTPTEAARPTYSGERRNGGRFEKCDVCSRFGATKHVEDRGPNGLGGRRTQTRWTCARCENKIREAATNKPVPPAA